MPSESTKSKQRNAEFIYDALCEQATRHFGAEAMDQAILDLHLHPSTKGKLRLDSEQVSTHMLLNICFLEAALNLPRGIRQRAYSTFLEEAQKQRTPINKQRVAEALEELAEQFQVHHT